MSKIVFILSFLPLMAFAQDRAVVITVAVSGVSAENLADTPLMDALNMEAGKRTNQLALNLAVTPGTSLVVDVRCYESSDGTNYGQISLCDGASPSVCAPDIRGFTLADYTADGSGVKHIATKWKAVKKYIKCSVDDPADGDGTVSITGSRSWQ